MFPAPCDPPNARLENNSPVWVLLLVPPVSGPNPQTAVQRLCSHPCDFTVYIIHREQVSHAY